MRRFQRGAKFYFQKTFNNPLCSCVRVVFYQYTVNKDYYKYFKVQNYVYYNGYLFLMFLSDFFKSNSYSSKFYLLQYNPMLCKNVL